MIIRISLRIRLVISFLVVLFLSSCSKPTQYFAKDRYTVTSNNLNIRTDPTKLSKTIGSLSKGDTIVALASDNYWIMVKVGDQTGFIAKEYLRKLSPITTPKSISFIERSANWKVWQFWIISIFLIGLWVISEIGLMKYEVHLKRKYGINGKNISVSPLIFFVTGILTGIIYLYWKDQVVESLFYKFSILPRGMGSIAWIIWIQCVLILTGMIIDFIGSIYRSGIRYGHITYILEQLTNAIIFTTCFFLTISVFVIAIIILLIFFTILYTFIVTENSKSFSGFFSR